MIFSYIIIDTNEYGDLTVRPTLNLDYCILIEKLLYELRASYRKQWRLSLAFPG